MEKNLTSGSVPLAVLRFSLPFLLSCLLQTLYGMADLFIIGQFCGVESTTAVSIGSQVMHMLTVMTVSLAMGATVLTGRAVGSGGLGQAARIIGNTVTLFMLLSVFAAAGLLLAVRPIAAVMSTPAEALSGTVAYLTLCFCGVPFITAYNIFSAVFRGMGDSRSPMYFVAAACVLNIALDYLFIGALGFGASGAALGTVLSQTVSAAAAGCVFCQKRGGIRLTAADFKPHAETMRRLLGIGVPVSLQEGFIQVSFIVLTVIANRRGLHDAAAVGIVEKMIGLLFLVPSAMHSTVSALAAQNIGAGRHDRARLTLRCALLIALLWGTAASLLVQPLSEPLVGLFVDAARPGSGEVVRLGGEYLRSYVWDCLFAGVTFSFSGYFCAYGRSMIPFVYNCISIVLARVPLAVLLSARFPDTLFPMGMASPAGSLLSAFICVGVYARMRGRKPVRGGV